MIFSLFFFINWNFNIQVYKGIMQSQYFDELNQLYSTLGRKFIKLSDSEDYLRSGKPNFHCFWPMYVCMYVCMHESLDAIFEQTISRIELCIGSN